MNNKQFMCSYFKDQQSIDEHDIKHRQASIKQFIRINQISIDKHYYDYYKQKKQLLQVLKNYKRSKIDNLLETIQKTNEFYTGEERYRGTGVGEHKLS